jgi:hypothetical protein
MPRQRTIKGRRYTDALIAVVEPATGRSVRRLARQSRMSVCEYLRNLVVAHVAERQQQEQLALGAPR